MPAIFLAAGATFACGQVSTSNAAATPSVQAAPTLQVGCSDASPCKFNPGTYRLADKSVLPGLQLELPAGWSSTESDRGELNLVPPGQPNDRMFIWLDLVAVKSTGAGHGTTILSNVGTKPADLISWLTQNPDFLIVSKPVSASIGAAIHVTTVVVGVSPSAQYGDPDCPPNPRCADLFTNPRYWNGNSYGIGGTEEVRLYLGTLQSGGSSHTFLVGLDAADDPDLGRLTSATQPIVDTLRLPPGMTSG